MLLRLLLLPSARLIQQTADCRFIITPIQWLHQSRPHPTLWCLEQATTTISIITISRTFNPWMDRSTVSQLENLLRIPYFPHPQHRPHLWTWPAPVLESAPWPDPLASARLSLNQTNLISYLARSRLIFVYQMRGTILKGPRGEYVVKALVVQLATVVRNYAAVVAIGQKFARRNTNASVN